MLGIGANERDTLVHRLEKPLLARGAVTSAGVAMLMAFRRCWAIVLLLLCLCVSSWGSCFYAPNTSGDCLNCPECITESYKSYCEAHNNPSYMCKAPVCSPSSVLGCSFEATFGTRLAHCVLTNITPDPGLSEFGSYGSCGVTTPLGSTCCDTQAEADSVACEKDPTLPFCAVVSDTLIFACSESNVNCQIVATIYKLSCKATNGVLTECKKNRLNFSKK